MEGEVTVWGRNQVAGMRMTKCWDEDENDKMLGQR